MQAFLLDLLNTTPMRQEKPTDSLSPVSAGREWSREHGGSGAVAEVRALRVARDVLQDVIRGSAPAASLAPLLQGVARHPQLRDGRLSWDLSVTAPRRLAVVAVLAWAQLQDASPGRLRACANAECRLFLLDRSAANTARWCSMARCGNRLKARRHHERMSHGGADRPVSRPAGD